MGRKPQLTEEQERQLSERAQQGDGRAVDRLVESNLRLVVSIASQYQGRGLSIDDLIAEGNMGLIKAATKYDATRGLRFAAYAAPHIRKSIEKALDHEGQEQRVEATPHGESRSVDAPLGAKPNISLLSVLADGSVPLADERVHSAIVERAVVKAIETLEGREQEVVTKYFGLDGDALTMAEIGHDLGLRRERVRQVRDRAVRRLRKEFRQQLGKI